MSGREPGTITVEALGVAVAISASSGELLEELRRAWEACLLPESAYPGPLVVAQLDPLGFDTARVMERVSQEVTEQAITARAGDFLMLHACAVADPTTRRSVILVGPSGMGKTTLAAELGKRWCYVTDETAGISPEGHLLPYPKPLSVIVERGAPKRQFAPAELGLTVWREPSEIAGVLLLDRKRGLGEASMQPIRTVPGVAMLAEHTSYLSRLKRPLGRLGSVLNATGGLHKVSYSEARQVLPTVDRILTRSP